MSDSTGIEFSDRDLAELERVLEGVDLEENRTDVVGEPDIFEPVEVEEIFLDWDDDLEPLMIDSPLDFRKAV